MTYNSQLDVHNLETKVEFIIISENSLELQIYAKQHPVIYSFLRRVEKADKDCLYFKLQRGEA